MNEQSVVWGEDGFASESGYAFVNCIDQSTRELLCSQYVWVVVGTGLPAGAFLDPPPPSEDGKAIVRNNESWSLVDDFRGKTAYNKNTKQNVVISEIGALPDDLTIYAPSSNFDVWVEELDSWVKDDSSEQEWLTNQAYSKRSSLLVEAGNEIAALIDATDPDINKDPSDAAKGKLLEWKKYRASIAVIDCSIHPVNWPEKPQ